MVEDSSGFFSAGRNRRFAGVFEEIRVQNAGFLW
jgi:hypothetical protein